MQEPVTEEAPKNQITKPKRQFGIGTLFAVVLVVAVSAFVLGSRSDELFSLLRGKPLQGPQNLDYSSVEDVYDKLRENFDGTLDTNKLIEGAKKGLVDAAGDPYTAYWSDEEAKQFLSDLEGKFSGIGAEIGKKDSNLVVVTTLDASPAQKAGLQSNDIIAKVNEQETTSWSIEQAVSEIRGDKGTSVKLTIVRGHELKEFSIVRDEIINPSVTYEITPENIGYLRISRFAETDTKRLARQAAQEFKQKGVKGVVLDLRGNGGGHLTSAQDVASIWINGKVVVEEKRGNEVIDTLRSEDPAILEGVKTYVLIDGGSASASEIVAGALHDHKAATLVGTKTFGKGSVQAIKQIPGGGQLKVTVAKWFTPNGKNISKEGIEPDVKVENSDADRAAGKDVQKDKVFELLKQ